VRSVLNHMEDRFAEAGHDVRAGRRPL
jgi:hypothetical protein